LVAVVSAIPEDVMREPEENRETPRGGEQPNGGSWQWLAIGILLACWLAEATLCAGQGL
jgi:hypothetical protein